MSDCIVQFFGSREWDSDNEEPISDVIALLPPRTRVVHGAGRGADRTAARLAKRAGHDVVGYPADWDGLGAAAGPIRNLQIAENEQLEMAYGFRCRGVPMPGSDGMAAILQASNIPYVDIYDDDAWRAEAAILAGASFLDEVEPAWYLKLKVDQIDFSTWSCVPGQLYTGFFALDWFDRHGMGGPLNRKRSDLGLGLPPERVVYINEPQRSPRATTALLADQRRLSLGWRLIARQRLANWAIQQNALEERVMA